MHADESEPNFSIDPANTLNRLRDWFDEAVKLPAAAREAWMAAHVAERDDREALRRLLAADTRGSILETSASELDARIVAAELRFDGLIGSEVGDFRIVRELGQGGMAAVFLCERIDTDFRQHAAVKLLHRGLYSDFERQLFRRERQVLASLEHPHIARLIDGGVTAAGIPYLIMEFVDGVPITQYVRGNGLDLNRRLRLFVEVCRAVEAAHQRLVVHRDIKPSNILVTAAGEPKLLDFGIAKLIDEDAGRATQTLRFYTPGYAAPEQTHGGAITTATDVYSLGVLLHELLLGLRPEFTATGEPQRPSSCADDFLARHAAAADPASPPPAAETMQHLRRRLRGDLDNIVLKALEGDPQRRYASAGALAEDIERHLDGRPVVAHPPTRWYRTRKFLQRHRGGSVVSAILIVAVLAALGLALWQAGVARKEAARANAVRDFLVQVFDAAKANLPSNQRPTPEVLVAEASRRAREDPSIDPALRADMLLTLSEVSTSLGTYTEAESLLDDAEKQLDRSGSPRDAAQRLNLAVQKGNLLAITDRDAQAEALLAAALPQLRAADSPDAVEGLQLYANIKYAEGHDDDAVAVAREVAAKSSRAFAADTLPALDAASFLGVMLAAVHRYGESAAELEPLLARWRRLGLPQNMYYAVALNNLAVSKNNLGDSAAAENLMREGIALRRKVYQGHPHDRLGAALVSLGMFLFQRERFDEARPLFEEAHQIYVKVLGADSTRTADCLYSIGQLDVAERKFDDAERHFRESIAIYADANGKQDGLIWDLLDERLALAAVLLERGQSEAAQEQRKQVLDALREHGEVAPPFFLKFQMLTFETRLALARGRADEALAAAAKAAAAIAAAKTVPPGYTARNDYWTAKALYALGRRDEARRQIEQALAAQRRELPEAHASIAAMLAVRARIESAGGEASKATATIDEARALKVPAGLLAPDDAAVLAGAAVD